MEQSEPPFFGGFDIYIHMKFFSILKSIITEARIPLEKYDVGGQYVDLLYNSHSNMATKTSTYGRLGIDEVKDSMENILEVIVELSNQILELPPKFDRDRSILVIDNQIGGDYHFWVNQSKKGTIFLTINTSIFHPKHLPSEKNEGKIIITKDGDPIIKESIDDSFTYKKINDIIIYYKIY